VQTIRIRGTASEAGVFGSVLLLKRFIHWRIERSLMALRVGSRCWYLGRKAANILTSSGGAADPPPYPAAGPGYFRSCGPV
jgi:hypothetical protein